MYKLPKLTFEFIYKSKLGDDIVAFDAWAPTFNGEWNDWQNNCQVLIPYNVYESFCRYQEDQRLIQKLKEITEKK